MRHSERPMNIKPIETVYNGYRFRSRLEARWAVFFRAVGIEYQYEPEGFDMDGLRISICQVLIGGLKLRGNLYLLKKLKNVKSSVFERITMVLSFQS